MTKEILKTTLLVDADIVAYQAAFSTEQAIRWGGCDDEDAIWTLHSDEKDCKNWIDNWFITLKSDTQCSELISCFSDKDNFRKKILSDYKANRTQQRKPITLKFCKDYIFKNYNGMVRPNIEADDILGILATSQKIVKGNKIIVSIDKDLDQIAGLHYNPKNKAFYKVTPKEAEYNFYYQVLVGDSTDNYKGLPSYGEVKTYKALLDCKNYWKTIVELFKKEKLTEEDALVQARVARILQTSDYDFKNKQPKLWRPSK